MPVAGGWHGVALTRQGLYRLLAAAFLPPEDVRLEVLTLAADELGAHDLDSFPFVQQFRDLAASLRGIRPSDGLAEQYVRLFGSGVDGALCPPQESWYVASAKGGGIAVVQSGLSELYRRFGFRALRPSEPVDHLTTELELMSALCSREALAWHGGAVDQIDLVLGEEERFLRWHPAVWVPRFARSVEEVVRGVHPLYRIAARLASDYVSHDLDLVRSVRRVAAA